jgi:hypothetical protein
MSPVPRPLVNSDSSTVAPPNPVTRRKLNGSIIPPVSASRSTSGM